MAFSPETYALLKAQGGGGGGGGESAVLAIRSEDVEGSFTLDKTWDEIFSAVSNGKICFVYLLDEAEKYYTSYIVTEVYGVDADNEYFLTANGVSEQHFMTSTQNGYPVLQEG